MKAVVFLLLVTAVTVFAAFAPLDTFPDEDDLDNFPNASICPSSTKHFCSPFWWVRNLRCGILGWGNRCHYGFPAPICYCCAKQVLPFQCTPELPGPDPEPIP